MYINCIYIVYILYVLYMYIVVYDNDLCAIMVKFVFFGFALSFTVSSRPDKGCQCLPLLLS